MKTLNLLSKSKIYFVLFIVLFIAVSLIFINDRQNIDVSKAAGSMSITWTPSLGSIGTVVWTSAPIQGTVCEPLKVEFDDDPQGNAIFCSGVEFFMPSVGDRVVCVALTGGEFAPLMVDGIQ